MRCQPAAHRQGMTIWRVGHGGSRRRLKSPPMHLMRGKMGRISGFICFILALLTVLSVTPAFLLFCACEMSPSCLARGFGNFLVGPGGVRKPAVVIMLAPLFVLLINVFVFVRCHRRRDVLDFSGPPLD